jgi:hypothetical protein
LFLLAHDLPSVKKQGQPLQVSAAENYPNTLIFSSFAAKINSGNHGHPETLE